MTFFIKAQKHNLPALATTLCAALLAGCGTLEPDYETQQRQALEQVGQGLGIEHFTEQSSGGAEDSTLKNSVPALPQLDKAAGVEDYLRFALLKQPRVRSAFYRWWQQVEGITPARSLPDPALVFQADITDALVSLMPGIMMDIPGWGKLEAAGLEAAAGAQVAYREYVAVLYQTAAQVRSAAAQLDYSEAMVALGRQKLIALEQAVAVAGAQYGTGSAQGASLQEQAESMNAQAAAQVELENRLDALAAARARFKSALGLQRADADPHWPSGIFLADEALSENALWEQAQARNPQLEALRAAVFAALAQVEVAKTAGTPDFAAGLMADVKMNPVMFRPELGMTLPVWRDKIAAILSGAQAGAFAAQTSLEEAELELAAELAQTTASLRRSERESAYLQTHALPNVKRALASADAGYRSGNGDFAPLVSLQLAQLQIREQLVTAQLERSLALAGLSLLVASPLPDAGLVAHAAER